MSPSCLESQGSQFDLISPELSDEKSGIQWSLMQCLEDLDFADDLCLMSQKLQHMQSKTDRLTEEAAKTGLKVNAGKTETMRMNNKQEEPITLGGNALKEVDSFTYLGRQRPE